MGQTNKATNQRGNGVMKVKQLNTREYSELIGLSFKAGMVSRRLREWEKTGGKIDLKGVDSVKRIGREWILDVLVSWIEGKENK